MEFKQDWENKHKVLENPKTLAYRKSKDFILSEFFHWFSYQSIYPSTQEWNDAKDTLPPKDKIRTSDYANIPFFSHTFLKRPRQDKKYPEVNSPHLEMIEKVIYEILDYNKNKINCFYRINANLVPPTKGHKKTIPHLDHAFEHNILLIYLTDAGGETVCVDDNLKEKLIFNPTEDSIMLFKAHKTLHYHYLAEEKNRVIVQASHI